jgi:hypothetical protein
VAWTTPKTWTLGQLVNAADLNEQIRDNMLHLSLIVDTATGKIPAISSTYFADLSGANLTGVSKLAANDDFTAGNHNFNGGALTRVVLPVGADKWAT